MKLQERVRELEKQLWSREHSIKSLKGRLAVAKMQVRYLHDWIEQEGLLPQYRASILRSTSSDVTK